MIKYRTILVVIDPSMESQPALYRAVEVARLQDNATITVFMSIYDFSYEITSILSVEERDEMREGVVAQRRAWLETLIQPYLDEGLDLSLKVVWHSRPSEHFAGSKPRCLRSGDQERSPPLTAGKFHLHAVGLAADSQVSASGALGQGA